MPQMSNRVKRYTPAGNSLTLAGLCAEMFRDLRASKDLSWRLAVRDTKSLYRQSVLGILWAFFTPLMNTLVWVFLNNTGVVKMENSGIPYTVYVFVGTMLWSILLESLTAPLQQTQAAQSMMTKINFPKEALIVSGIYKILFNSVIKIVLIIIAMIVMGVYPNQYTLLFPVALISLILFGTAIGLFITPIGMLYTDIGKALPILMQFFMYFSPVVYMAPKTGKLATLININPITPLITNARNWLTGFQAESLEYFIWINVAVALLLFIGWLLYRISIPIIVERMSS